MWNMFKVNNEDTRIHKDNNKVKNKDIVNVVLASLLLTLNTFLLPAGVAVCCSDALRLLESIDAQFSLMKKLGE